jgi:hypothetical protein
MEMITTGHQNPLPSGLEPVGGEIVAPIGGWERNVEFKIFSYDEALTIDQVVAHWISLAQNPAVGSHT